MKEGAVRGAFSFLAGYNIKQSVKAGRAKAINPCIVG